MRISEEYLLKQIFDKFVLIPVGEAIDRGEDMVLLNETGYIMAKYLLEETDCETLLNKLATEFEADEEEQKTVKAAMDSFLKMLSEKGILTK